jgi:drug/metabolite transporter (DMT)-like permease
VIFKEFILFVTSIIFGITGQFFLKAGALELGKVNGDNILSHIISMITTPKLLIGLTFYGLGAVTYILLLTRVDLSVVGPAVALGYVFSMLIGIIVFKEPIIINRLIGLGLIVCGVILVIWKK